MVDPNFYSSKKIILKDLEKSKKGSSGSLEGIENVASRDQALSSEFLNSSNPAVDLSPKNMVQVSANPVSGNVRPQSLI